uniref:KAT8 regulatory NSL complex subunit 2 n=1 Tax=Anopheles epiroticus TaxID=199890 RepID=A0A182PHR8_9DIPT
MGPTHLQTGRPTNRGGPSPGTSSQAMDQALRSQIQQEIERKAKVCSYTQYECTLPRVESYAYCFRHILQDPNAAYKQCEYVFSNGRRCLEPSPKYDVKKDYGSNYCFEHSRQTQLIKTKSTIGKLVPVETTETLLHGLAHHVKVDKVKQHYMGGSTPLKITVHEDDDDTDVDVVTPSVDPFVDVDVTAINDSGRIVLDYASDSSDEDEAISQPTYGSAWKAHEMDNSDNESVDSQSDDPLKHAGIYTAEEVTRITKEKLTRLQSLYIEQIHRLQHVLRERRRNYLKEQRAEREIHCSIYDQVKQTPRERTLYEKLKGLNRYHRKHGVEAILQRKYLEKRAKATEGLQQKPPSLPKCAYTEGGVKCGERTLPCCKHCRKHILEDKKQVLFRACGIEKSGVVCQEPLAGLFENLTCPLHMELPAQRSFNKRKYESESEGEGEVSGVEVPAVSGEKVTTEVQEDKKGLKVETNPSVDVMVVSKTSIRGDSKRKVIKTEPVTPPVQRVRNTRSSRAVLAMQEVPEPEQPATEQAAAVREPKSEQTEPKDEDNNVTIAHNAVTTATTTTTTVTQMDDANIDLEESLLPVSVIPKNPPTLDKDTNAVKESEVEKMDTTTDAAETAKSDEKDKEQTETTECTTVTDLAKDSTVEDKKNESSETTAISDKQEQKSTATITQPQEDASATLSVQKQSVDEGTITPCVEASESTAPKNDQPETVKTTPKVQPPLTARQRKLRLATERKESAAKESNAPIVSDTAYLSTSDEEKAKKGKGGKQEPVDAGVSSGESKSRRQK